MGCGAGFAVDAGDEGGLAFADGDGVFGALAFFFFEEHGADVGGDFGWVVGGGREVEGGRFPAARGGERDFGRDLGGFPAVSGGERELGGV